MASLNLAMIVLRLVQNPRGWRVDDLCAELEIAPRTYRKYRRTLQDQFRPFFQNGTSRVQEVLEPGGRYLRLVAAEGGEPMPGPEARHEVDLLFADDRWLKRYLREGRWFPGQSFEEVTGGRLRMRFRVAALEPVIAWLGQFSADVEVLRPIEVRRGMTRQARPD